MLLHAFPTMSVSSLREFPENCVYRHCGFNCFITCLHRKLLTTNFYLMILKVLKNVHLLDLYIKTTIFLFYNYINIITCHFSYHTLYQHSFIYHPLRLSALGLISLPRADKGFGINNAM